jgi:hypothetical protein
MTNSYKKNKKSCFFKRILECMFQKPLMLEAPIEYTQKEVRVKSNNIINYLNYRN